MTRSRLTRPVRNLVDGTGFVREIVEGAVFEAGALGSRTVEAEHLLLALARRDDDRAAALLAERGLDHDGLRTALDAETERSLRAVGVDAAEFPAHPRHGAGKRPRPAESFKLALRRAARIGRGKADRSDPLHVLLGVLAAPVGTVPRALDAAGVDPAALRAAAEAALSPPTADTA
jgi:ATP-dependent Clp protease ATP-binding subunit ClpA